LQGEQIEINIIKLGSYNPYYSNRKDEVVVTEKASSKTQRK